MELSCYTKLAKFLKVYLGSYGAQVGTSDLNECVEGLTSEQVCAHIAAARSQSFTVVHLAAARGDLELIRCILKAMNQKDIDKTLLTQAAMERTPLHQAVIYSQKEVVHCILEHVSRENKFQLLLTPNDYGNTAAQKAAWQGCMESMKSMFKDLSQDELFELLKAQNSSGNTVLHYIAKNGHVSLLLYVVGCLSDRVNTLYRITNNAGRTSLQEAQHFGNQDVVDIIDQYYVQKKRQGVTHADVIAAQQGLDFKRVAEVVEQLLVDKDKKTQQLKLLSNQVNILSDEMTYQKNQVMELTNEKMEQKTKINNLKQHIEELKEDMAKLEAELQSYKERARQHEENTQMTDNQVTINGSRIQEVNIRQQLTDERVIRFEEEAERLNQDLLYLQLPRVGGEKDQPIDGSEFTLATTTEAKVEGQLPVTTEPIQVQLDPDLHDE